MPILWAPNMMSAGAIQELQREAAQRAAREGKVPLIYELGDGPDHLRHIPSIGTHRPPGYRETKNLYFVDSSGWGEPGEPALTFDQFAGRVRPGFAYAIVEEGQFQVYIQEFSVHTYPKGKRA